MNLSERKTNGERLGITIALLGLIPIARFLAQNTPANPNFHLVIIGFIICMTGMAIAAFFEFIRHRREGRGLYLTKENKWRKDKSYV